MVFKNSVLDKILGAKREEITRDWSKLHNEDLHNFYTSPNDIQVINSRTSWAGYVTCVEERRGAHRVLVVKPAGMRPLGRYRH